MIVEKSLLQDTLLKNHINNYSLFTTQSFSKEQEYLLIPSTEKTIYIGLNCDFKITENIIQIKEKETPILKITTLKICNLDKTYRVVLSGNPIWFSITFFPFAFTHFTEECLKNNLYLKTLLLSKQGTFIHPRDIQDNLISYLKSIYRPVERIHPDYILPLLKKGTPITEIAKQLNISYRTLYRYFKTYSGYTPSLFVRVMRLNLKLQEEQSTHPEVDLHFYDASHFTRECKHFIGYTPTKFIAHFKKIDGTLYKKITNDHSIQ